MDASIRVRVGSRSERFSAEFAFNLLTRLEGAIGHRLTPIQITTEPYVPGCTFSDVRTWDWPSSTERLRRLAKEGADLVILSSSFLDWDTPAEYMNDDLYRFEDELNKLGITVISIEAYSQDDRSWMIERFRGVHEWFGAEIEEILLEMVAGYRTGTLCFPYGALPYFLLNPVRTSLPAEHLRAFVGFQPWQYGRIPRRWPTPTFPMENMLAGIDGQPLPKTGAIPIELKGYSR